MDVFHFHENLETINVCREEVSLYGTPKEEVAPATSTSRSVGSNFVCLVKILFVVDNLTLLVLFDNFNTVVNFGTLYTFSNVLRSHKYSGIYKNLETRK